MGAGIGGISQVYELRRALGNGQQPLRIGERRRSPKFDDNCGACVTRPHIPPRKRAQVA